MKKFYRPCEKISVNSTTVIKNDIVERLEKQPLRFFTVYNGYCNLSRFFLKISLIPLRCAPFHQADFQRLAQPSLSGYMISSSPRTLPQFLSGIVHFFVISWVARYKAFRSAVSLGNTLLCLFRRR